MANLEDTVRLVVQDFIKNEVLFTALDVSNSVKQSLPHARHREVRDVVRSLFSAEIETQGWARTPIQVALEDGTTTEALLYHPLSDSWDLDNKYDAQKRAAVSARPVAVAQAALGLVPVVVPVTPANMSSTASVPTAPVSAPAPIPMPTARALWDQMFKTQPSLFPRK